MWLMQWLMATMSILLVCKPVTNNCGPNPLQAMIDIANNTGICNDDTYRPTL